MANVRVYQYGCSSRATLDGVALGQLRLAHELRNSLVEIERAHAERVADGWASRPDVAGLIARLAGLDAEIVVAVESVTRWRASARSKGQPPTDLSAPLRELKAARKTLREHVRDAKRATYDALAPTFHAAYGERRAAIRRLYALYVQERGLYWPTFNDVVAHHEAAMQSIAAQRKKGMPAEIRFHRWTGEGTLTMQLQATAGKALASPGLLSHHDDPENPFRGVLQIPVLTNGLEGRAGIVRGPMKMRIGSQGPGNREPVWCELPVIWHRPIPEDGVVKRVQVTQRMVGSRARVTVAVTVNLAEEPVIEHLPGAIGIDIGWRQLTDGAVRVATFASTTPFPRLTGPIIEEGWLRLSHDRCSGQLVVPDRAAGYMTRLAATRSARDKALDLLKVAVAETVDADEAFATAVGDDDGPLTSAIVARWRSPARFARLAHEARNAAPDHELTVKMLAWDRHDRHVRDIEAHGRDKHLGYRDEMYRVFAAACASSFGSVQLNAFELTRLAKVPDPLDGEDYGEAVVRSRRTFVAPSSLVGAISNAAKRERCRFDDSPIVGRVHEVCGAVLTGDPILSHMMRCDACGLDIDQDGATARRLRDRVTTA